jgi:hypothetical protein
MTSTPAAAGEPTVGDVRDLLARHGVPGAETAHYALAATVPPDRIAVLACCDAADDTAMILAAALMSLTGDDIPVSGSGRLIVRGADLDVLTALAREHGLADTAVLARADEALAAWRRGTGA